MAVAPPVAAAQKLGRRWIGIDITHLAITLMKKRLTRRLWQTQPSSRFIGEPTSVARRPGPGRLGPLPVPVVGAGPRRRPPRRAEEGRETSGTDGR
ncbi:MAG: hypothetical protein M0C28_02900 [Candidatus Moduliflexus flocculans]|nr:hypothetical protein [Candidatus Moduliflexus flocculans]